MSYMNPQHIFVTVHDAVVYIQQQRVRLLHTRHFFNNIFWELNCYGTIAFPLTLHHFVWQEKPPENNTTVWVWFIWDYQSNARFILTDTQNRTRRPVGDYKCVEDWIIPTFIWTQHAVKSFSGPSMVCKSTLLQCSLLAQGLFTPRQLWKFDSINILIWMNDW